MEKVVTKQGIKDHSELISESQNIGEQVYEVVRIMDGIALFLEDHFARLKNSMILKGFELDIYYEEFQQYIEKLVRLNKRKSGNVKFLYEMIGTTNDWYFSFIPHSYPGPKEYQSGVSVELLFGERENPNAKVMQQNLRERANKMIADMNIYEVLLVDRDGLITEGSRSNVFFVKGNIFYTAPASKVLEGITRQKVLECLKHLNFQVIERAVHSSEIGLFDAVFLTGTSPKVLPIRSIGKQDFNTGMLVVNQLIKEYDHQIMQYVRKKKSSENTE